MVTETFKVLKGITAITRLRVVCSPAQGRWTEWKSHRTAMKVVQYDEWPSPEAKMLTAFFDPESQQNGFISAAGGEKLRPALELLTPMVWSALLLRAAADRLQKVSFSEAELVRATLRARDEERRHIARELHDDLGQSLASLKLGLKWVEDLIRTQDPSTNILQELSRAREDVGVMLEKVRDLSHTLYPRILDTLGLTAAVKELVHQATRFSQLSVEFNTQGKPAPLDRETEIALYRCCQEAINNAIRHSQASKLGIRISFDRNEVRLMVEDNGKGFNPRTLHNSDARMMTSGFWTIRQRLAHIGAAFLVSTAKGRGTLVEMIVPRSSRKIHVKGKDKVIHRG